MAKQKNRKKALKLELKRKGVIQTVAPTASAAKTTAKKSRPAKPAAAAKKEAATSNNGLAVELEGMPAARIDTFVEAGIQSVKDFAKFTEKEILALKGIGPATIKQLVERGVSFKA